MTLDSGQMDGHGVTTKGEMFREAIQILNEMKSQAISINTLSGFPVIGSIIFYENVPVYWVVIVPRSKRAEEADVRSKDDMFGISKGVKVCDLGWRAAA